jgi:hypothetical protein
VFQRRRSSVNGSRRWYSDRGLITDYYLKFCNHSGALVLYGDSNGTAYLLGDGIHIVQRWRHLLRAVGWTALSVRACCCLETSPGSRRCDPPTTRLSYSCPPVYHLLRERSLFYRLWTASSTVVSLVGVSFAGLLAGSLESRFLLVAAGSTSGLTACIGLAGSIAGVGSRSSSTSNSVLQTVHIIDATEHILCQTNEQGFPVEGRLGTVVCPIDCGRLVVRIAESVAVTARR